MKINKPELINNASQAWKFWSIQAGVIGTAISSFLVANEDVALQLWALLPEDLKAHFPPEWMPFIGIGIFVVSMIARVLKQRNVEE